MRGEPEDTKERYGGPSKGTGNISGSRDRKNVLLVNVRGRGPEN